MNIIKLFKKVDISEAAKEGAIKEAREEVGVEVKDISFLHKSVCGATVVWDLYYFVVKDFNQVPQTLGEEKIYMLNQLIEKKQSRCVWMEQLAKKEVPLF